MVAPLLAAAAPSLIGGFAGMFGRSQPKQTETQRMQQGVLNQLLQGVQSGTGPFADLFQADEEAFQKSFVDPAMRRFETQIAPGIQQQFAAGQQRGTALDDALARAGIDVQSQLGEQFAGFQQQAQQRKLGGLQSILGSPGFEPQRGPSALSAFGQGVTGTLASEKVTEGLSSALANLLGKK